MVESTAWLRRRGVKPTAGSNPALSACWIDRITRTTPWPSRGFLRSFRARASVVSTPNRE